FRGEGWGEGRGRTLPPLPFRGEGWGDGRGRTLPPLPFRGEGWGEGRGRTLLPLPFRGEGQGEGRGRRTPPLPFRGEGWGEGRGSTFAHTPLMVYRCPRADSSSRLRWSAASRSFETSSLIRCPMRSSTRAICRPICSTLAFCDRYRSRFRHSRACSSRSSATERRTWQSRQRPFLVCELGTCLPQSRQKINKLLI